MQSHESRHLLRAAELSLSSAMRSTPAPRSGVVIVDSQGRVLGEAFARGQGSADAEVLAVRLASKATKYACRFFFNFKMSGFALHNVKNSPLVHVRHAPTFLQPRLANHNEPNSSTSVP